MKNILILMLILGLSSCTKDDIIIETEEGKGLGSISGQALLDTKRNGEGDMFPSFTLKVYYIDSVLYSNINNATCKELQLDSLAGELIGETETDEEGNFEFIGVQPDKNNFLFLCYPIEYSEVIGFDTSPDGDEGEEDPQFGIPISIEENENDTENIFLITEERGSIQGKVEVDLDGDGTADVSVYDADLSDPDGKNVLLLRKDEILDLYISYRTTQVDENGNYAFDNLIEGQYIVRSNYETGFIIFSEDESPDFDGTPSLNDTDIDVYIAQDELDSDNNFILQKPPQIPGIVRGTVTQDFNSDGIGDMPLANYVVEIREWDGTSMGALLLTATSDVDGKYEFLNVFEGDYALTISDGQGLDIAISYDNSGDPISGPGPETSILLLDMSNGEIDEDNIFVMAQFAVPSISGYVLDDVDGDGIGDEGLSDHRIELYERSESGVPTSNTGSALFARYSEEDGSFSFYNIPAGEYVLYHIGTGAYPYLCISGEDQSSEVGEPTTSPDCSFIPVDLIDDQKDADNIFTLDKQ